MKQAILDKCDSATYLNPNVIDNNKKFILDFYNELDKPERLIKNIKTKE